LKNLFWMRRSRKLFQFEDEDSNVEDIVIKAIMIQKLKENVELLNHDEIGMINALFYKGYTEREYAKITGIPQKTINDRKLRTLRKLKKLLENKK
jgi:DNA-directed RNA polymerase specialized sigma24 family protein